MYDGFVPPHLAGALRQFEEAMVDVRTRRTRLEAIELPDVPVPSDKEMAQAAARDDAPPELKAAARAVAAGRIEWHDVVTGRTEAGPEVAAFQALGREKFDGFWERGQQEDEKRAEAAVQKGSERRG